MRQISNRDYDIIYRKIPIVLDALQPATYDRNIVEARRQLRCLLSKMTRLHNKATKTTQCLR